MQDLQDITAKELECLIRIKGIDDSILEFGKMGILNSHISNCSGCISLKSLGYDNGTSNNYCIDARLLQLYNDVYSKPCRSINLDCLVEQDKKRVKSLLDKMALNKAEGEEYKNIKKEFIEIILEFLKAGVEKETIRDLVHTYNDIRSVNEAGLPKLSLYAKPIICHSKMP